MLDHCVCPKCERMIMLDGELPTGFCLYCGTHIAFDEARECLLSGLRSSIPDEFMLEIDLSGLIDEDDAANDNAYGLAECREECAKALEYGAKWDFAKAYEHFSRAFECCPTDFEAACGRLTSGLLKLNDVENWESRLHDCIGTIRTRAEWDKAQKALSYALDILKKFLSKGGRFVAPYYTYGFFRQLTESFPAINGISMEIFAHCLNVDNAPFTDAARLDHETTRFAVGSYPAAADSNLRFPLLLVLKHHEDEQTVAALCRALYVYERGAWLRNRDTERIEDVIGFMELAQKDIYAASRMHVAVRAAYDLLMMGGIEQNTTPKEKLVFLSRVYTYKQIQRMEQFFGDDLFFRKLQGEVYLRQQGASPVSAEYKRILDKIDTLSVQNTAADHYGNTRSV